MFSKRRTTKRKLTRKTARRKTSLHKNGTYSRMGTYKRTQTRKKTKKNKKQYSQSQSDAFSEDFDDSEDASLWEDGDDDDDFDDNSLEEMLGMITSKGKDLGSLQKFKKKIEQDLTRFKNPADALTYLDDTYNKETDLAHRKFLIEKSEEYLYQYYRENPNDKIKYPSLYDTEFANKLYRKAEFYQNRIERDDPENLEELAKKKCVFSLSKTQRLLKNFIGPDTPYKGILVFHGLGVGKTCAAITIAEQFKKYVRQMNQKIIVITKARSFNRNEIFDFKKVKNRMPQCAGENYLMDFKNKNMIHKCQSGDNESCRILKHRIDKIIRNHYIFYGAIEWAKKVVRDLKKSLRSVPEHLKQEKEIKKIKQMFSNTVLIIDEVHHLKDVSNSKSKIVPPVLFKVLEHADNLRLVMLTATPMFHEPSDIISLINYLLVNDKRPTIKESQIMDSEGDLTPIGKKLLIEKSRGYISFLRGENPIIFPKRLSAKIHLPDKILTPQTWPTKDIYGQDLPKDERIKHLELIGCPMSKYQNDVYKEYINKRMNTEEERASAAYSSELQILNYVYQTVDEVNNLNETYGDRGFKAVFQKVSGKLQWRFRKKEYADFFVGEGLKKHSSKIYQIIQEVKKSTNLKFIYTEYNDSGVLPLAMALEMIGYRKYRASGSNPTLLDYNEKESYKGDYLIVSGDQQLSKYRDYYISKGRDMIHEPVKVIIATKSAAEGFSIFGVREIHILNPWHNINRIEQAIGRGLRNCSHIHLPPEERNVMVYLYVATYPRGDHETVDQKIYREAESKAIKIGIIEDVLRRNAIDCQLNKENNVFPADVWTKSYNQITSQGKEIKVKFYDTPFTRLSHYLPDTDYKCYVSTKIKNPSEIDYSTYNLKNLTYEVMEVINKIKNFYLKNTLYTIEDFKKYLLEDNPQLDLKIMYQALKTMLENQELVYDNFGRPGYLIYRGKYYIYQPIDIKDPTMTTYHRAVPPPIMPKALDISAYIQKLSQEKINLIKHDQFSYQEIIEYLQVIIDDITEEKPNALFVSSFKLTNDEIYEISIDRLLFSFKNILLKNLVKKLIEDEDLDNFEKKIVPYMSSYILRYSDLYQDNNNDIYGYRIISENRQNFMAYNKGNFFLDEGNYQKFMDTQRFRNINQLPDNALYGYLKVDKISQPPLLKIRDARAGERKAIKGISCIYKSVGEISDYLDFLSKGHKISKKNKKLMCDDIELILRRNDKAKKNNRRWFYNVMEYVEKEDTNV